MEPHSEFILSRATLKEFHFLALDFQLSGLAGTMV